MHLKFVHCKCYKCREAACHLSLSLSFSNIFTWQTYNALFIIRSLSKYFVEHLSEELILQQFEAKPKEMGGGSQVIPHCTSFKWTHIQNVSLVLVIAMSPG